MKHSNAETAFEMDGPRRVKHEDDLVADNRDVVFAGSFGQRRPELNFFDVALGCRLTF